MSRQKAFDPTHIQDEWSYQGMQLAMSPCTFCKHKWFGAMCAAFPQGIPDAILMPDGNDHKLPFPGDHGIQFEDIRNGKP